MNVFLRRSAKDHKKKKTIKTCKNENSSNKYCLCDFLGPNLNLSEAPCLKKAGAVSRICGRACGACVAGGAIVAGGLVGREE